jgi:hypothetical protein
MVKPPEMDRPPKLWRLVALLVISILIIIVLYRYAAMNGAH